MFAYQLVKRGDAKVMTSIFVNEWRNITRHVRDWMWAFVKTILRTLTNGWR